MIEEKKKEEQHDELKTSVLWSRWGFVEDMLRCNVKYWLKYRHAASAVIHRT